MTTRDLRWRCSACEETGVAQVGVQERLECCPACGIKDRNRLLFSVVNPHGDFDDIWRGNKQKPNMTRYMCERCGNRFTFPSHKEGRKCACGTELTLTV